MNFALGENKSPFAGAVSKNQRLRNEGINNAKPIHTLKLPFKAARLDKIDLYTSVAVKSFVIQ